VHEIKHDGYRLQDKVRLFTRRGFDWRKTGDRPCRGCFPAHVVHDRWRTADRMTWRYSTPCTAVAPSRGYAVRLGPSGPRRRGPARSVAGRPQEAADEAPGLYVPDVAIIRLDMPAKLSKKVTWPAGARSEALPRRLQYPALLLRFPAKRRFASGSFSVFGTDGGVARLPVHRAISMIGSCTSASASTAHAEQKLRPPPRNTVSCHQAAGGGQVHHGCDAHSLIQFLHCRQRPD
jgi:hypothetical protein